jgi:hypothetical protein
LIALLLLNAMGYYVVFVGMQLRSDSALNRQLDDGSYDESQTISIKIPINVPYATGSDDFERVSGNFSHNGEVYRLVKQKYFSDTLTIICIRDLQTERIQDALSDYVKTFTDHHQDQTQNIKYTTALNKDFISNSFNILSTCAGWQIDIIKNSFYIDQTSSFYPSIIHPPQRS